MIIILDKNKFCFTSEVINKTYSRDIDRIPAPKQNAVKRRTAVEKLENKEWILLEGIMLKTRSNVIRMIVTLSSRVQFKR